MRRHNTGFTLIEVMVALAIVAVTLGAGIKAAGALADNSQHIVEVTAAQWCAENQLTELRLSSFFTVPTEFEFQCEQLGASYKGKLVSKRTPNPNFLRADAQIFTEDGKPILTLSTVLGRSLRS
ncbi:MAG: type II secretion system minor pseudopilin GspI [Rhizobacter sp.]|nr:type II secretion system minor pseudopilin GspI [Rhizobacter sp.]